MVDVDEIDTQAAATLMVVWRVGNKAHGRVVRAGGEVTDALRGYAETALQTISTSDGQPYDPNDEQDDEVPFLTADRDELLDTALLERLQDGPSLPLASHDELRARPLTLYALLLGNDPNRQTVFVRKSNPVSLATKSIVAVFDDALTRVKQPILSFDSRFDAIVHPDKVWILNQKNFGGLFKESEAVLAKTAEWAANLNKALPIADGGEEYLTGRLRKNSSLRRKVLSVLKSDYLPKLTPEMLREQMEASGLEPDRLLDNGALVLSKDTERDVLLLLNEDLWTGNFSGDRYAATRKARRS